MFSNLEMVAIVWCVSILFNAFISWSKHDTGAEWDGVLWALYTASIMFAPIVAACNFVDEFPYANLNKLLTKSMFSTKENHGNEC